MRHIFVAVLPLLAILWYTRPLFEDLSVGAGWQKDRRALVGWVALGFVLMYGPRLVYNVVSGGSVLHAVGIGIVFELIDEQHVTDDDLRQSFVGWVATYFATAVLLLAPYLVVLGHWRVWLRRWWASEPTFLLVAALSTSAMFVLTAFNVLWKYYADRWGEAYIEERYTIYLVPMLPILALVAFERLRQTTIGARQVVLVTGTGVLLVIAAYGTVVSDAVWPVHPFSRNPHASAQLLAFQQAIGALPSALLALVIVVSIAVATTLSRFPRASVAIWMVGLCGFYLVGDRSASSGMDSLQGAAGVGRLIAQAIQSQQVHNGRAGEAPITVQLDPRVAAPSSTLEQVIGFWGVPRGAFVLAPAGSTANNGGLVVSTTSIGMPLAEYLWGDLHIYVSEPGLNAATAAPLRIQSVNPASIKARTSVNVQSNGDSAGWLASENATIRSVVELDDKPLQTVVANGELVTFVLPKEVLAAPGSHGVVLVDPASGQRSNAVEFEMTS